MSHNLYGAKPKVSPRVVDTRSPFCRKPGTAQSFRHVISQGSALTPTSDFCDTGGDGDSMAGGAFGDGGSPSEISYSNSTVGNLVGSGAGQSYDAELLDGFGPYVGICDGPAPKFVNANTRSPTRQGLARSGPGRAFPSPRSRLPAALSMTESFDGVSDDAVSWDRIAVATEDQDDATDTEVRNAAHVNAQIVAASTKNDWSLIAGSDGTDIGGGESNIYVAVRVRGANRRRRGNMRAEDRRLVVSLLPSDDSSVTNEMANKSCGEGSDLCEQSSNADGLPQKLLPPKALIVHDPRVVLTDQESASHIVRANLRYELYRRGLCSYGNGTAENDRSELLIANSEDSGCDCADAAMSPRLAAGEDLFSTPVQSTQEKQWAPSPVSPTVSLQFRDDIESLDFDSSPVTPRHAIMQGIKTSPGVHTPLEAEALVAGMAPHRRQGFDDRFMDLYQVFNYDDVIISMDKDQVSEMPFVKHGSATITSENTEAAITVPTITPYVSEEEQECEKGRFDCNIRMNGHHIAVRGSQREVYETTTVPAVDSIIKRGLNATVFVYGATSSGKTFTLFGADVSGYINASLATLYNSFFLSYVRERPQNIQEQCGDAAEIHGEASRCCGDGERKSGGTAPTLPEKMTAFVLNSIGDTVRDSDAGIAPRVIIDVFQRLEEKKTTFNQSEHSAPMMSETALGGNMFLRTKTVKNFDYDIRLGFVEIYKRDVTCLISGEKGLTIRERTTGGTNGTAHAGQASPAQRTHAPRVARLKPAGNAVAVDIADGINYAGAPWLPPGPYVEGLRVVRLTENECESDLPNSDKKGGEQISGERSGVGHNINRALGLIEESLKRRRTSSTYYNVMSSRSHAIVQLFIRQKITTTAEATLVRRTPDGAPLSASNVSGEKNADDSSPSDMSLKETVSAPKEDVLGHITNTAANSVNSVFNLVDLAGSERQKLHDNIASVKGFGTSSGAVAKEANAINLSLACLAKVINEVASRSARANGNAARGGGDTALPHVSYRSNKLTYLLKEAIGGNSHTVMIATICGSLSCYSESLLTLKYARSVKLIKNKTFISTEALVASKMNVRTPARLGATRIGAPRTGVQPGGRGRAALTQNAAREQNMLRRKVGMYEDALADVSERNNNLENIVSTQLELIRRREEELRHAYAKLSANHISYTPPDDSFCLPDEVSCMENTAAAASEYILARSRSCDPAFNIAKERSCRRESPPRSAGARHTVAFPRIVSLLQERDADPQTVNEILRGAEKGSCILMEVVKRSGDESFCSICCTTLDETQLTGRINREFVAFLFNPETARGGAVTCAVWRNIEQHSISFTSLRGLPESKYRTALKLSVRVFGHNLTPIENSNSDFEAEDTAGIYTLSHGSSIRLVITDLKGKQEERMYVLLDYKTAVTADKASPLIEFTVGDEAEVPQTEENSAIEVAEKHVRNSGRDSHTKGNLRISDDLSGLGEFQLLINDNDAENWLDVANVIAVAPMRSGNSSESRRTQLRTPSKAMSETVPSRSQRTEVGASDSAGSPPARRLQSQPSTAPCQRSSPKQKSVKLSLCPDVNTAEPAAAADSETTLKNSCGNDQQQSSASINQISVVNNSSTGDVGSLTENCSTADFLACRPTVAFVQHTNTPVAVEMSAEPVSQETKEPSSPERIVKNILPLNLSGKNYHEAQENISSNDSRPETISNFSIKNSKKEQEFANKENNDRIKKNEFRNSPLKRYMSGDISSPLWKENSRSFSPEPSAPFLVDDSLNDTDRLFAMVDINKAFALKPVTVRGRNKNRKDTGRKPKDLIPPPSIETIKDRNINKMFGKNN